MVTSTRPRTLPWALCLLVAMMATLVAGTGDARGATFFRYAAFDSPTGGTGLGGSPGSPGAPVPPGPTGPAGSPGSTPSSGSPYPPTSGPVPPPPGKNGKGKWVKGVTVTEYWPAPESWFVGKIVKAPGLAGKHRVDWLYSATGVSMEGDGIGLDGKLYHIDALGQGGWVTAEGKPTTPKDGWQAGPPFWRAGDFWQNVTKAVTFPLQAGGWFAGKGKKHVPLNGVSFAAGESLPVRFYQSIAVDPKVIPLGSRVYIPAYRRDGHGGWFVAQDTGGGIIAGHVDVYRAPPASPADGGKYLTAQRIYVIKPQK